MRQLSAPNALAALGPPRSPRHDTDQRSLTLIRPPWALGATERAKATRTRHDQYGGEMTTNDIVMLEGGPLVDAAGLEDALGWTLKPEGLCKDDACVIVSDREALFDGERIDITAVASLLDRPATTDTESGLVAIGAPREQRRAAVNDMKAPDFVLPDIDGLPMNFSDHRSKKRLLVAFSSW